MKHVIVITEGVGEYDDYNKYLRSTWVINRKIDHNIAFRDHLFSEYKKAGLIVTQTKMGTLDFSKVKGNVQNKLLRAIGNHWTVERFIKEVLKGEEIPFFEYSI